MSDEHDATRRPIDGEAPEVDEVTPELRELLARFSPDEIETGVVRLHGGDDAGEEAFYDAGRLEGELRDAWVERSLGRLLRSARAASELSLADVAERLSLSRGRVHQIEREGANLEIDTLRRVADALGYDVHVTFTPRDGGREALAAPLDGGRPDRSR